MSSSCYCPRCLNTFEADGELCPSLGCRCRRPLAGWSRLYGEGDLLDRRYRVIRALALGGAGVTYHARELDADDQPQPPDLAIKVLHPQRDSGAFLRRLATEAQILRDLAHDHIVECLAFVQRQGEAPYLVTRFEAGGTLEELVEKSGPLPPWTVAGIVRQILEALSVAHAKDIVHRDLKPANVLLRRPVGRLEIPAIRIADFGIAKVQRGLASGMTRQGAFIGTPQYAAPEQFIGESATTASDLFSAGAVCWFLLTGRPPLDLPPDADLEEYFDLLRATLPPKLAGPVALSKKGALLSEFIQGTMRARAEERWTVEHASAFLDFVLEVRPAPPAPRFVPPSAPLPAAAPRGVPSAAPTLVGAYVPAATAPEPAPAAAPEPAPVAAPERARRSSTAAAPTFIRETVPAARSEGLLLHSSAPPAGRLAGGPIVGARGATGQASSAMSLDDLFADPPTSPGISGRQPVVQNVAPRPFRRPVAQGFEVGPKQGPVWWPVPEEALPDAMPPDVEDLLRLLAVVRPADRGRLVNELLRLSAPVLQRAITDYRAGGGPAWGRGAALAIELLGRRDWEAQARSLLTDPDAGVRAAAAAALGRVGEAAALKTLAGMLRDRDGRVRVAAVRGISQAALLSGRAPVGLTLVRAAEDDPEPRVREAAEYAVLELERG